MLIYLLGVLAGCLYPVEELDPAGELVAEDHINYRCYDYHLACLDAYDQVDNTFVYENEIEYSVYYRKPVGDSDEPAAIPTEIIATCTDPAIFSELVDFVLNPDYSGTESYTTGYYIQSIEPKESFLVFISVYILMSPLLLYGIQKFIVMCIKKQKSVWLQ